MDKELCPPSACVFCPYRDDPKCIKAQPTEKLEWKNAITPASSEGDATNG